MGECKKGSKTVDRARSGGNVSKRRQQPPYRVRSSSRADREPGLPPRLCLGSPPPTIPPTRWHEAPPSSFGALTVSGDWADSRDAWFGPRASGSWTALCSPCGQRHRTSISRCRMKATWEHVPGTRDGPPRSFRVIPGRQQDTSLPECMSGKDHRAQK